jgi:internalin A
VHPVQNPQSKPAEKEAIDEAMRRIGECIRRRRTVLDLGGLQLRSLPSKIAQLPQLTELNLAGNCLESLPPELAQFRDLARLNLSQNPLTRLPQAIGRFSKLTRLDITHTPLRDLPPEIGLLTGLTRLYLDHNRLESLPPEIAQLTGLTRLGLSHNALTAFPGAIAQLGKLTRLDLSHNRLKTLAPEIGRLTTLTVLDLSHNPVENLPPEIGRLTKLTVLKTSSANLAALPAELGQLANLSELDLAGNALTALPGGLRDLENLDRLYLHDNPALQLSPLILGPDPRKVPDSKHASAKSILDFHFGRQSGTTRPLNEGKLILLGNRGAGKSTIVRALRDLPCRESETSTPGVVLCDWMLEGPDGEAITVHVWDFSGQPVTHALHPFFFSPGNLYLLVLSGRDHHEREDAEYWLRMVETHGMDPQGQEPAVIVAMNQWNVPGGRPEVDRIALRGRFPFIRGFVEMDCKVKKGIPALKAAIFRELERMPWVREPFPDDWDMVRRAIVSRKHLTESGFRELCLERGVKDAGQQDYLSEILHHIGIALHDRIGSTVMQSEWLVKHLYPLLHRAENQAGILKQADVDIALPTEHDGAARSLLMKVLESSGLAFSGNGVWLLPHTQPEQEPGCSGDFRDDEDAIRLRYTYQTIPEGLLARIILRRFDFIGKLREQKLQWRYGVILSRKGARALILLEPQQRQLSITVTGPTKTRNQLAELCQAEMHEIHAGFPGCDPIADTLEK